MKPSLIAAHNSEMPDSPGCQTYFDEMSESWELHYAPNGSMVWRLTRILEPVKTWVPAGGRLLDIGCGEGDISAQCAAAGYNVDGIDMSPKMIERARSRFKSRSIEFNACADTLHLPFADGTFDAIVASSVLEYVVPLRAQLEELRRVCKDGGRAVFTVPNVAHPLRWLEAFERLFFVPIRGLLPRAIRKREDYIAISINRFSECAWNERLGVAGWKVLATAQKNKPLFLMVLERDSSRESNAADFRENSRN
jgi:ubiquinone/menaquinone biosynthesis C-methylase UbiE